MARCKSEEYKRDEGYYQCDLEDGHKGQHECKILFWWID